MQRLSVLQAMDVLRFFIFPSESDLTKQFKDVVNCPEPQICLSWGGGPREPNTLYFLSQESSDLCHCCPPLILSKYYAQRPIKKHWIGKHLFHLRWLLPTPMRAYCKEKALKDYGASITEAHPARGGLFCVGHAAYLIYVYPWYPFLLISWCKSLRVKKMKYNSIYNHDIIYFLEAFRGHGL